MSKQRKPKTDFDKKLEREAKVYEPMFWLIPEWLRIIKPMDLAIRIEQLELELEMRRIGRLGQGTIMAWVQDTLYRMMKYAWLYVWISMLNIFGVVMLVVANVLWFWLLGYVIYWMFTG